MEALLLVVDIVVTIFLMRRVIKVQHTDSPADFGVFALKEDHDRNAAGK